jgi:hypothetical protein
VLALLLSARTSLTIVNNLGLTARQEAMKACVLEVFETFHHDAEALKGTTVPCWIVIFLLFLLFLLLLFLMWIMFCEVSTSSLCLSWIFTSQSSFRSAKS